MIDRPVKTERYIVVKNTTGRLSCWPVGRPIPKGWSSTANAGTKQQCLDAIGRAAIAIDADPSAGEREDRLRMSLMYFGDSQTDATGDKYRLLFESARFADQNGFEGIWLPERHFTDFGCLYPSPAVLHAALARETQRIKLRAGSVVLPLNDPVRVAEQWAVVDNLSGGRVEIAFASGWHADDFALMPDAYEDRNRRMFEGIDAVESLWRGQAIQRRNGAGDRIEVRTYPTPLQQRLPVWLTAAGNPATFRRAGQLGYGVLTHLFNQDIAELKQKIEIYRSARREAGHRDTKGCVAVTLHAFVAESIEEVRQNAGKAYCQYLRANLGLLKQLALSQGQSMNVESLPRAELDQMLDWLLEKFIGGRSLMGTVSTCTQTCQELAGIGVSEVACLLDFGPDTDDVISSLPQLARLNEKVACVPVA